MATVENRSRYRVTVKNRPDKTKLFPYNCMDKVKSYMQSLRAENLKPKTEQLDESWLVRIRQTGYKTQQMTCDSLAAANTFIAKTAEERARGLFRDYTRAHKATFAELLLRYHQNELGRLKSRDILAYKIEGWLEDSGPKGCQLLQEYREQMKEAGKPIRPAKFKMRQPSTELVWIHKRLSEITTLDIEDFISERLEVVSPATVDREIDILKGVFKVATVKWEYNLDRNPMDAVSRPRYFNERDRILKRDEERRMLKALAHLDNERAVEKRLKELGEEEIAGQVFSSNSVRKKVLAEARKRLLPHARQTAIVEPYLQTFYHFQDMTAARLGETLGLTWDRIDFEACTALLPETKNGRSRKLSLRTSLLECLHQLPRRDEKVFRISKNYLAGAWSKACELAEVSDFHIHDLRHMAITKVASTGKFSLLELQQFSGHRDLRMLARYAHLCASQLAKKLDESFKDAEHIRIHKGRPFLNSRAPIKARDLLDSNEACSTISRAVGAPDSFSANQQLVMETLGPPPSNIIIRAGPVWLDRISCFLSGCLAVDGLSTVPPPAK